MSWNIKFIGEKKAVRRVVEVDESLPETVKAVILDHLQDMQGKSLANYNGVRVEGFGHKYGGPGSYISHIGKLEIVPIEIILPIPGITPVNESNPPIE